jgi:hypothetical protein
LLENEQSYLKLKILLLNSRGGPWFSFGPDSIEDSLEIELSVSSVNMDDKIIRLIPKNDANSLIDYRLLRRVGLDRFQWCVKFSVDRIAAKSENERKMKNSLSTIIAPDTIIDGHEITHSISSIDMRLFYTIKELESKSGSVPLQFKIKMFECSLSYFFSKIDIDKHHYYGSWSIHSKAKRQHLQKETENAGLMWSERFWNFDIVLHWLNLGDLDCVGGVVEFIKEHESVSLANQNNRKGKRFLRNESIKFP